VRECGGEVVPDRVRTEEPGCCDDRRERVQLRVHGRFQMRSIKVSYLFPFTILRRRT
jgi:hypothetical protein